MQENIGDWLYLIVLVIAGISSAFGSGRKKRQQQTRSSQPNADSRPTEREIWQPTPPTETNTAAYKPVYETIAQSIRHDTRKDIKTVEATIKPAFIPQKNFDEDHFVFSANDLPKDTDEWRKAFIYNEIFKRKYQDAE